MSEPPGGSLFQRGLVETESFNHVLLSRNPIPIYCIPMAMGIAAAALLADVGRIYLPAVPPTPAHNCEMVAANRPVTDRAVGPIGQAGAAITTFINQVAITNGAALYTHLEPVIRNQ